ncbi:hypothetical protein ACRAWF_06560 [Streptomyces sp. L7]
MVETSDLVAAAFEWLRRARGLGRAVRIDVRGVEAIDTPASRQISTGRAAATSVRPQAQKKRADAAKRAGAKAKRGNHEA